MFIDAFRRRYVATIKQKNNLQEGLPHRMIYRIHIKLHFLPISSSLSGFPFLLNLYILVFFKMICVFSVYNILSIVSNTFYILAK